MIEKYQVWEIVDFPDETFEKREKLFEGNLRACNAYVKARYKKAEAGEAPLYYMIIVPVYKFSFEQEGIT